MTMNTLFYSPVCVIHTIFNKLFYCEHFLELTSIYNATFYVLKRLRKAHS